MTCVRIMKHRVTNMLSLMALLAGGSFMSALPASAGTVVSTDLVGGYRGSVLSGSVYGNYRGDAFFNGYSEPLDWGSYYSPFGNAGDFAGNARVIGPTRGFFERMFDRDEHRHLIAPQIIRTRQSILVPSYSQSCE